jgi:hypothetical protein
MVRIRVTCAISGPAFFPDAAERVTGLTLDRKSDPGQINQIDRLQGRSSFLGRAELAIQEYGEIAELGSRNAAGLMALARSVESLRRAGATELVLKVDVEYSGQCQFELSPDLMRRFADLGIPVSIACFASDVTEELGGGRSVF